MFDLKSSNKFVNCIIIFFFKELLDFYFLFDKSIFLILFLDLCNQDWLQEYKVGIYQGRSFMRLPFIFHPYLEYATVIWRL